MKSHTPGPWLAIPTTAISRNPDSLRMDIVTTTGEWNPAFIAGDILPEDARLIASAPDLLAVLQQIADDVEAWSDSGDSQLFHERMHANAEDARFAISKAKGKL